MEIAYILNKALHGDIAAISRLITIVENEQPETVKIMAALHKHTGNAHVIGITGPPGVGKSTLVSKLITEIRKKGKTVGVIAVDPTSPFTGGALLGDRVRMQELSSEPGVFIRSLATRGSLGGLSKATSNVIKILDACGKDIILVETVGAGQSEVDIMNIANTSVVVIMPGLGDEVQAIKAGIMEIADIFVINKADRDGVDATIGELEMMLDIGQKKEGWKPPIIKTIATANKGIAELYSVAQKHLVYLKDTDRLYAKLKEKTEREFMEIVRENLNQYILDKLIEKGEIDRFVQRVISKKIDPYTAAEGLLKPIKKMGDAGKSLKE
jgi:LAO/AO transport system kinase